LHDEDGPGESFGRLERIVWRAGGPPVDAPTPTSVTLAGAGFNSTGNAAGGTGGVDRNRGQRRTTLTSDISLIVCRRFATRCSNSGCSRATGFSTQATAPTSIKRNVVATSLGSVVAVQM